MATRRGRAFASHRRSKDDEVNEIVLSSSDSDDVEMLECDKESGESDGSSSDDDVDLKRELYKEVLVDYKKVKELKRKLMLSVSNEGIHLVDSGNEPTVVDTDFLFMLDSVSRCKLPVIMKNNICKAIENHCHASSIDYRSKKLVLEVLKIITEFSDEGDADFPNVSPGNGTPLHGNNDISQGSEACDLSAAANNSPPMVVYSTPSVPTSCMKKHSSVRTQPSPKDSSLPNDHPMRSDLILSSSNYNSSLLNQEHVNRILEKLSTSKTCPAMHKSNPKDPERHSSGYQANHDADSSARTCSDKLNSAKSLSLSGVGSVRKPLQDISNVNLNVSIFYCILSIFSKFVPANAPSELTPNLSKKRQVSSSNRNVTFASTSNALHPKKSPEVQILGEATLSQNNQQFTTYATRASSQVVSATPGLNVDGSGNSTYGLPTYHPRENSSGGKLPIHGPRRPVKPGHLFHGDFQTAKSKFSVSKSELKNYRAICNLATSQFSNEDAVSIAKENLFKDIDEANEDVLARAFKRSSRNRPLSHCNNVDMGFDEYELLYPDVTLQPLDNTVDSGIYAMMFLEHWKSSRSVMHNIFDSSDIPNIRLKIANDLVSSLGTVE
ncbi:hypothetical protein C2845_PM09G09510 [Panicum miliaceum]|uniref:Uncharacterized protein n=1 Tax=Panicum miliaceum TaxID=4540 RepID=A0A3L6S0U8_PANMI|nr:hypothetical protein C2845_PM09G09510 [Panicum miliaceum]